MGCRISNGHEKLQTLGPF